uniref:Uncharacterized protein n=1 Tax=Anguilla anguilla TaxID=7936 RepID=A0A0E9T5G6_ANGAN
MTGQSLSYRPLMFTKWLQVVLRRRKENCYFSQSIL